MNSTYILALDEGTSSARALVFDLEGRVLGLGRRSFELSYPQPGWVEQDPEEIWEAQMAAAQEALHSAGILSTQLNSIGITNQRETTVIWDKLSGKPIAPAIVWQDRRTSEQCAEYIQQGHQAAIHAKTGLLLDPYFSATKINWLLNNIPESLQKAKNNQLAFGTIDSWLLWKLSNGRVHATDVSNASRTLLCNLNGQWDSSLCDFFGIPQEILPRIIPSAGLFATTQLFGGEIPITGILGDQQAALFGQGCVQEGMLKNTYGTGCFMLMNIGNQPILSQNGLITTIAWQIGNQITYALEGAIFSAGASLQWLESIGVLTDVQHLDTQLADTTDTGDVYFVPAFAGLGTPHWDPNARGTIVGLTRGTTKNQLIRAALEGMAFQSQEVIQSMVESTQIPIPSLQVDGGVSENNLLMQFQADISGIEVNRPKNKETTAWGAALIAAFGNNLLTDINILKKLRQEDRLFIPNISSEIRNYQISRWQNAVSRAKNWANL
ncbi:MAG: glycerol kinase GlpK [Bacteroidia bacterium]|nr:glycerol kinase GlpK [Bacteroidia bacterium]